jgi:hypothetical protein
VPVKRSRPIRRAAGNVKQAHRKRASPFQYQETTILPNSLTNTVDSISDLLEYSAEKDHAW